MWYFWEKDSSIVRVRKNAFWDIAHGQYWRFIQMTDVEGVLEIYGESSPVRSRGLFDI